MRKQQPPTENRCRPFMTSCLCTNLLKEFFISLQRMLFFEIFKTFEKIKMFVCKFDMENGERLWNAAEYNFLFACRLMLVHLWKSRSKSRAKRAVWRWFTFCGTALKILLFFFLMLKIKRIFRASHLLVCFATGIWLNNGLSYTLFSGYVKTIHRKKHTIYPLQNASSVYF